MSFGSSQGTMKSIFLELSALVLAACALAACSSDPAKAPSDSRCSADNDCDSGHCDPKSGCVECIFDSQCEAGQRCDSSTCHTPTSCDVDDDCSGDFSVCHPSLRECVRCLTNAQCGDSARCVEGSCQAFQRCEEERDCSGQGHCDLGSGECVACLTRGDCDVGSDCVSGQCLITCEVEADCAASGTHCSSTGHCSACATDAHCPEVYHCAAGRCERDVCAQGTTGCDDERRGVEICSPNGDSLFVNTCASGQSCAKGGSTAKCEPWWCSPGQDRCNDDGTGVQHCAEDGLSIASEDACGEGERCIAGRCATPSCEPLSTFCRDGASYTCGSDGTESTLLRACRDSELCDPGTGECVNKTCAPGATTCMNGNLGTCKADGSIYDFAPCGDDGTCTDGVCKEVVCAANTTFCSGSDVMRCDATGTVAIRDGTCPTGCSVINNFAYCSTGSCTPGAQLCNVGEATTCKPDGSGPDPDGVSCAAVDAYCDAADGTCKPYACAPSQRFCQGEYPMQCWSDGAGASYYSTYPCDSWYWNYSKCNPATGQCQAPVCTPNTQYCVGSQIQSCDATGYVSTPGEDCATDDGLCVQGQCQPKICEPGTYTCQDGNVHQCADGTSTVLYYACDLSQHCVEGYYFCQADVCVSGTSVCNGNAVSICKADGSGPASAGTACGAGKACIDGACKTTTCTPYALSCIGGHVHACDGTGTSATLSQYCVAETFCDPATATCKTDLCPAGKAYCDAETYKTCKADGSGAVDAGTVCSASSKVCTLTGCAATALDVMGDTGTLYAQYGVSDAFFGNVIKVTQTRKLTKIEADLAITGGPVSAHWLVFSSTDGVTFYQASDTAASLATTADAWVSSPALSVELQAGIYYLIGFEVAPGASSTVSYRRNDKLSTPNSSFAQVLGSASKAVDGPPANIAPTRSPSLYYLRVTTTLP